MTSSYGRLLRAEQQLEAADPTGWRRYLEHGELVVVDPEARFRERYFSGLLTHKEIRSWLYKQPWRRAHRASVAIVARIEAHYVAKGWTLSSHMNGPQLLSALAAATPIGETIRANVTAELKHFLKLPAFESVNSIEREMWRAIWFDAHVVVLQVGGIDAMGLRRDLHSGFYPYTEIPSSPIAAHFEMSVMYFPRPFEEGWRMYRTAFDDRRRGKVKIGSTEELLTRYSAEEQALWPP